MNKWFHAWFGNNRRMIGALVTILMVSLLCQSGCLPAQAATQADWTSVSGILNQEGSDQYNSGRLQILPLDNGGVLFELSVMQGSESEDSTTDFRVSGTFSVNKDGTGAWEENTENGLVSLQFILDGSLVKVTQTGIFPVPVEGTYNWLEQGFEVTPELAEELLKGLDSKITGLNQKNGDYRLETSELEGDGSFYINAVSADSGKLINTFLITNDLRSVYRYIDSEAADPIYELTDSMMKAVPGANKGGAGNAGLILIVLGVLLVAGVVMFVLMNKKREASKS